MNWKKIVLIGVVVLTISSVTLTADVWHGKSGSFGGVITAVENNRDSFTVENNEGIVKMFQVSPSRKGSLVTGSRVTVGYVDDYTWPLRTTSISGGGYVK
ncbi:MAG: hypothetical protein AAF558_06100 [Verrucomicrobiota bacterium]